MLGYMPLGGEYKIDQLLHKWGVTEIMQTSIQLSWSTRDYWDT